MKGRCDKLEIDTRDICLLCLESKSDTNCYGVSPTLPSLQGLKHLLRYLKVSPKELFNCSSEFLQSMEIREDIELKISLCSKCSSVTEKFNKLYQEYELIQLQFGNCVQSLHESMRKGNENPERVRKYKDQMRPTKSADLVNASIAANLRNETLKKCSLKLQSAIPRVQVALQQGDVEALGRKSIIVSSEIQVPETQSHNNNNAIDPDLGSLKLQPGVPRNRIKSGKAEVETCSKLPTADDVGVAGNEAQLPEPEDTFRRETRSLRKNTIKSQFYAENKKQNVPQQKGGLLGNDSSLVLQRSTKTISGIKTVAAAKPLKRKTNKKISYFNAIRKKLKTKPTKTTATATINEIKDQRFGSRKLTRCEYCEKKYTSPTLRVHLQLVHPEHFILKFLPSNISSELCKHGVQTLWEQMLKVSGGKCQFCQINISSNHSFKCHLIHSHAQQFATKVLDNIQKSVPQMADAVMATAPGSNYAKLPTNKVSGKTRFACEFCDSFFKSKSCLKPHKLCVHPEHIVYKFFSPHTPLELCKQVVDVVLKQILNPNQDSEFGYNYKCKYCPQSSSSQYTLKSSLKIHVVSMHADQIAIEAQQSVGGIPENFEVASSNACSRASRNPECESKNNPSEYFNESNETSPLPLDIIEMDFEEESLVKMENQVSENVELDPLDVGFLD